MADQDNKAAAGAPVAGAQTATSVTSTVRRWARFSPTPSIMFISTASRCGSNSA